ncbi:MAG: DNA-directed DNA polymerase epsilon, subunit B [Peltula sp. TS41687]|nr:MAG: DNA-directed DNA polymerase epsilon, subunit B [Peltula sp. TS41687]
MATHHQAPLAPVFRPFQPTTAIDAVPSSSPAFGTPAHPIKPPQPYKPAILPILLAPASLRPLAFRTFTKKHDLTLTSSALQALATFIGKQCGSGWREEGLAELVLEEVAKTWKRNGGGVIVEGNGEEFKKILKNIAGCMLGGRLVQGRSLSRHSSAVFRTGTGREGESASPRFGDRPEVGRDDSQASLGMSELAVADRSDEDEDEEHSKDPRSWLKVIGAFEQPRITFDVNKKHFEREKGKPSLLPPAAHKTRLFQNRYNIIHQRVLRNEAFQRPTFANARIPSLQRSSSTIATPQRFYKLTPIANLLGRSGSSHLLLGLLTVAPTGTLAICDPTGSISLDLQQAKAAPENGAWFAPGMIVLVDGVYEEEYSSAGGVLGNSGGVGGTIGGRFIGLSIGGPPCERRDVTLGQSGSDSREGHLSSGGGFGWVDFLGVGSERALGSKMRRLEERIFRQAPTSDDSHEGRGKIVILGEVTLDKPDTLEALRKILGEYASRGPDQAPMAIVLVGNFVEQPALAGGSHGGSVEDKECFNSLASVVSGYSSLLQRTTFIFVPGDNDPWASAFSAGASTILPRKSIPDLFTSRIKRAFAAANAEAERTSGRKTDGEAIWTTNPSRVSLFGPSHELVLFRDDISGRLRRNAVRFRGDVEKDATAPESSTNGHQAQGEDHQAGADTAEPMEIDSSVQAAESILPTLDNHHSAAAQQPDEVAARKLVKTILDQGYLTPFPLAIRPVSWDHMSALQLYPLPTALVLVDAEMPAFTITYEGCHVMNPGRLISPGKRKLARWVEYDVRLRRGTVREVELY